MPHISILYTGGTIGMVQTDAGYAPQPGFEHRLADHLPDTDTRALPSFSVTEIEPAIDSANIVPNDWSRLVTKIGELWSQSDGFVIVHGTDTMAYTASALSFMMLGLSKPVIVTGAQIPLVAPNSDGAANMVGALLAASDSRNTEVMIYFDGLLLRGNRAQKVSSTALSAFHSPNFPIFADDTPRINGGTEDFSAPAFTEGSVALVSLFPGQSTAQVIRVFSDLNVRGIVLESYGLGNPPDANQTFMRGLADVLNRGISVVNITQCQMGGVDQNQYATGQALASLGVIDGADMTRECAIAKLQVLIARGSAPYNLRQDMARPLCGEMTVDDSKTQN